MSGYGMGGYVGSGEDAARIRRYEKKREEQRKKMEEEKKRHENGAGIRQFGTGTAEMLEAAFKTETVGLVSKEEFMNKRNTLKERYEEESKRAKREAEEAAEQERQQRAAKKAKSAAKSKLSFLGDDEEEGEDAEEATAAVAVEPPTATGNAAAAAVDGGGSGSDTGSGLLKMRKATLGKDPTVATDFLPDRDREAAEEELRDQLKKEYTLRQQLLKNEPLEVTYSYWDGSGHRRKLVVRKGDTIADFLRSARDQLSPDFRELRGIGASDLMYIKEDIILPAQLSFYELIVKKARGKSGPLFHFDVHEDVRLQHDARVEKDESHAGKVVERHWYQRNKHIFPASRWEYFDSAKNFERYTVHGDEVE